MTPSTPAEHPPDACRPRRRYSYRRHGFHAHSGRRCAPSARACPRPRGQPGAPVGGPLCDCAAAFAVTVEVTVAELDDVDNRWDTKDAEGVERTQSDERGRATMTEGARRWVRFANLRLRMLTSLTPREQVAFMCALPNRRTVVWSGDPAAWERCVGELQETRVIIDRAADPEWVEQIHAAPRRGGGRGEGPKGTHGLALDALALLSPSFAD